MKKLALGFALILFGILLELAAAISANDAFYWLGLISGAAGLYNAIDGYFDKKQ